MLEGFSIVMGVTSLELELLAYVLGLGSLCSLPLDLDQILPYLTGLVGLIKAKTPSTSINHPKQTHAILNAILIGTDLRVGSKSLCFKVGLLFHFFP